MNRAALLLLLPLALAACGEQAAGPQEKGPAATSEVLPGSISDAMVPLDQINSQAPLAPRQAQSVGDDIDDEQPEVTPAPGIDPASASQGPHG
jgi:hypothetical protein